MFAANIHRRRDAELLQPLVHLARARIRERHAEDPRGLDAARADEARDAVDEALRLPAVVRDGVVGEQVAPIAVKRAVTEGVDGVAVSPALALQAARKSPLHAEEEIRKVAAEAKAKGKKAAKRPKGEGVAAKAKKQAKDATDDLLRIGDELATMILDEKVSYDLVRKQAKVWQRKRGQ